MIWIEESIIIPDSKILFSSLLSNLMDKTNEIKPKTGKIKCNATLKPSLILECDSMYKSNTFKKIIASAASQLNVS
jgi:hypothetical protein